MNLTNFIYTQKGRNQWKYCATPLQDRAELNMELCDRICKRCIFNCTLQDSIANALFSRLARIEP